MISLLIGMESHVAGEQISESIFPEVFMIFYAIGMKKPRWAYDVNKSLNFKI